METCEEIFEKICYIEYKKEAEDETVQICNDVLSRDCEDTGPEVCEAVFETECKTSYHEHEVEEDEPDCRIMMVQFYLCNTLAKGVTGHYYDPTLAFFM